MSLEVARRRECGSLGLARSLLCRLILLRTPNVFATALEPSDQFRRVAKGRRVTAVDLVGGDTEAIPHNAPDPGCGEEPILTTQQIPRRNVGPCVEWPRLLARRL